MKNQYKREEYLQDVKNNLPLILMLLGVLLVLLNIQIQIFTKTDLNYSAFGGFLFIIGFILLLTGKKRR